MMIKQLSPFIALGVFLTSLVSCANSAMQSGLISPDGSAEQTLSEDYQIGPEDVLEILVWKNEALSKTVNVRPDGKISLPLVGDVPAAGLTPNQVKEEISEKLKEYYKEPPHVSVIVQQANSYVIYMLGEVKNPAQYVVKRGTTFLQAIALAGGFTPFASTNNILILRSSLNGHDQSRIKIRYRDIVSDNHPNSNIILKPGDTIVVP
jgi:polysaccharide export outer membrane protein